MSKRELNISDKPLLPTTKEDIILKSPFKIPPKELLELQLFKGITNEEWEYYDIVETENQAIHRRDTFEIIFYGGYN